MSGAHRSGESSAEAADDSEPEKDLPECKIKRNYSCATCDYFTQNPRHYLYHLRDVHKEKVRIYECPNCLYASKHFQKLLRHTKMVHGSIDGIEMPEFARNKGRKRLLDDPDSEDEDESEPSPAIFKCALCPLVAKSRPLLERHERDEHGSHMKTKFFRCAKCTYVTHMKARFTKHVKYHSMPMIKCDLCDFRTPYKWNLDRHCKNHNGKGAFRCSACNFTADIKQSLTVHEMNHHVPPVGQAAGLGYGRRRNKVGASDSATDDIPQVASASVASEPPVTDDESPKAPHQTPTKPEPQPSAYGSDFLDPDDIVHHANGNVYIKNKCKLCNFKSAWDGEMAKHEQRAHGLLRPDAKPPKKTQRPIPNLIPIPISAPSALKRPLQSPERTMSQKDINDICAKSANSALKDFASLFSSEDVFTETKPDVPDLIPAPYGITSTLKRKNASFFDKLKEKLLTSSEAANLTCQFCGHESKCLTESAAHQKTCGSKQRDVNTAHLQPIHNLSSTRCQHCRQRCKSSTDLLNHLQTCPEAFKAAQESSLRAEPHPMENRVFVWNNIEAPMDVDVDTDDNQAMLEENQSRYDYPDDKLDDNISLDLSIRTQSPSSENSFGPELPHPTTHTPSTDKIPTHGTDISVAQHKRVFKCPHCSFWASTASRFHVHIVGHLNKKPFECSLCAYRSNWRWDITKHIKLKSVRDPAHEDAKVLMTDETGRRNYTKYNKYLTEIHLSGDHSETSGGSGTRHRASAYDSSPVSGKVELPKLTKAPSNSDFSPLLKSATLRPPPALKAADGALLAKISEKKRSADAKRTQWKCKKCNYRDASRDKLLEHVKGHYPQASGGLSGAPGPGTSLQAADNDEASLSGATHRGQSAPFRCGHCHQVSNWKHVIQRHCRLKHSGDIRVVVGTRSGPERLEIEDQIEEPDHVDVPQLGTFKCKMCPFSNNDHDEFELHLERHDLHDSSSANNKCGFCAYYASSKDELCEHLKLHGVREPDDYLTRSYENDKRHRCASCPYVTNSKSQYQYHKQFHRPRGGQYACSHCGYNVSKRHLLHQHLKVHGVGASPQKSGDLADLEDISDEIEEVQAFDAQNFPDIPLVWVSKNGKFYKMYKCRFCPHVNLRKVNIQEHEKMHGVREKNPNTSRGNEIEHHCQECNYVCNNAGVLSSHSKVHQGSSGTIHCLVDNSKTDDEQIRELSRFLSATETATVATDDEPMAPQDDEEVNDDEPQKILHFCDNCPGRFLQENEYNIHTSFHGARLFYKCEFCTYTARQKPHLLAHTKVHTDEYQERTKTLQTTYNIHPAHSPPRTCIKTNQKGDFIWIVDEHRQDYEHELLEEEPSPRIVAKSYRNSSSSSNVPLSGTELFQQKEEALLRVANNHEPNFVYPTVMRNGRKKEKRYKCPKCPSAFEKREQFKVHLGLHGAKQRYKCEHCDYSVKYYANYSQHLKKHQANIDALMTNADESEEAQLLQEEDVHVPEVVEEKEKASKNISVRNGPLQELSTADKQYLKITQRRFSEPASANNAKEKENPAEDRKLFWCPNCPYTNHRKDAVDNHQKRHISVSGSTSNYTCQHCDYSVPQQHFLRDHVKIHFQSNRVNQPDGFLSCNNMKLTTKRLAEKEQLGDKFKAEDEEEEEDEEEDLCDDIKMEDNEALVFRDNGTVNNNNDSRFEPVLNVETLQKLNNNDGEKVLVNASGELIDDSKLKEEDINEIRTEECTSLSQIISDN